jgi:hypothetical protein
MEFEVTHNGRTYGWEDGVWFDRKKHMVAPEAIRSTLDAEFVRLVPELLQECEPPTKEFLFELLKDKFRLPFTQLCSIGFVEEVYRVHPPIALQHMFAQDQPPSGRSFANCKHLRDRFFTNREIESFTLPVRVLGNSPFEEGELADFFERCGVALWEESKPVHALVLGRKDWGGHLDDIVDEAEGSVLQVYSQEMFVSILAGHPDPFRVWPLKQRLMDLYAFRDRHPGLEYVSQGWAGWIKGVRSRLPITWADSTADITQVEQSPLAVMGYRVGTTNGRREEIRRQILQSAFQGPLPFVESAGYMELWGQPRTAERLRHIAKHIMNRIESNRHKANFHQAIQDWSDDLAWMKETFYRGVYAFNWPQV